MYSNRKEHVMSDLRVMVVHGPLRCKCVCSLCEGHHCWLEDVVDEDDGYISDDPSPDSATLGSGDVYLACRHCDAWADVPSWWDPEFGDVEFVNVAAEEGSVVATHDASTSATRGPAESWLAWMAERRHPVTGQPQYLTMAFGGAEWTDDPLVGLHFVRRVDVERFLAECNDDLRIVQHEFVDPPWSGQGPTHLGEASGGG